jgi:hypothetical protein
MIFDNEYYISKTPECKKLNKIDERNRYILILLFNIKRWVELACYFCLFYYSMYKNRERTSKINYCINLYCLYEDNINMKKIFIDN